MPTFEIKHELITGIALADHSSDYSNLVLHMYCEAGSEKEIYDSLPSWLHKHMEVVQGCQQVYMYLKKNQ